MMYPVFLAVSFFASLAGSICGIGGGVIIKPVLDAFGIFSVSTVSFLSGCTVLSMSAYNVFKSIVSKNNAIDLTRGTFLGLGAVFGGISGKYLFEIVKGLFPDANTVGAVQAAALLIITLGTLLYTVNKSRIRTLSVQSKPICIGAGLALGIMSSFLGIGGGPINLVVLFYLFSMPTKVAAQNSLYIILLSQLSSLIISITSGTVPEFRVSVLLGMVVLGILGGMAGRKINKKISEKHVDKLFLILLVLIMLICLYNFRRYSV